MGRPGPANKSGLFAMKGPKDAVPQLARGAVGNGRGAGALSEATLGLQATAGEGYATVDEHVAHIYARLGVRNAPAAVNKAHRLGLFPRVGPENSQASA